jgi:hypothetical protein
VTHQKVTDVFELTLDAVRASLFDHESAILIVTIRAPSGRVTRLTNVGLPRGRDAMPIEPCRVVT